MTDEDEYEEGCGFSWDHTLDVISVRDGYTTYVCRECGAEIIDGPAGDSPARRCSSDGSWPEARGLSGRAEG